MPLIHGGDWAGYKAQYGGMPLDFSANVSPLGLPDGVRRAMAQSLENAHLYPDPLCRALRAGLAEHLGQPAEQILCGAGAADLIFRLVLAVRFVFDAVGYLAGGMPAGQVFGPNGPCGPRYLRYVFFLQMWLPSEDWMLWNNRNALWTMSAFAFFYLLAPWLHRLLESLGRRFAAGRFWGSFALLLACLGGKGLLGRAIEQALNA